MLSVLKFIFKYVADFCAMLFTIDVDDNLSIGLLLCIIFILLPIIHRVICFIRQDAIDELNSRYDETRPRDTFSFTTNNHLVEHSDGSFTGSTHYHSTRKTSQTFRRGKGSSYKAWKGVWR